MGRIRYTVTTITKRCPHCGEIVDKETHGEFTPFLGILFMFTFPVQIPYLIIRYLALKDPDFPSIGEKFFTCPHCSLPIRTNNYAVEDLDDENLFLHKFKKWAYISYIVGAVLGICVFAMLLGKPIASLYGLFALLSLIVVIAIVIAYHAKLEEIKHPNVVEQPEPALHSKETPPEDKAPAYFYCRKCGTKLPSDSQFCNKCGTEVVK